MLLAETRTITNTSQAKQVTWEEVVAEFAGRVRRVTDIQWHGKVLYEYESIRTDDLGNSRN